MCVSSERDIPEARRSKGAEAIIKQITEEKCIDFKRLEASEQKGLCVEISEKKYKSVSRQNICKGVHISARIFKLQ